MDELPFIKMHGLGNDFVVLDLRERRLRLGTTQARAVADRRTGVGCDQVISVLHSERADAFMRIQNADGEEVEACGNGTRCVASLLFDELGRDAVSIETVAGLLSAERRGAARVSVDMGPARLRWDEIPLAEESDTLHVALSVGPASAPVLSDPCCVNMGNPHAVFFVPDADAVDLATVGPILEHHPLFPERANIGVAEVRSRSDIRLRVWERGAGLTLACGSGACAAVVAAVRRDLSERTARLHLDGGELELSWPDDAGGVLMTGPVATSFTGVLDRRVLDLADAAAA